MASQIPPTQDDLKRAFNRTLLGRLGYTFDTAMGTPAIKLSLTRVAQAIARPAKPSHMRGALND